MWRGMGPMALRSRPTFLRLRPGISRSSLRADDANHGACSIHMHCGRYLSVRDGTLGHKVLLGVFAANAAALVHSCLGRRIASRR